MGKKDGKETEKRISVIFSTVPSTESGMMAKSLVDRNLAACVNVVPVRSYYQWNGEPCEEEEHLLIIKTRKKRIPKVIAAIRLLHPYEVPEIIALPVNQGHPPYIQWVYDETRVRKD
jgi:periplasmic divalent cation tolerance protein